MSITNDNKIFMIGSPTWANACVGNNGSPEAIDYAEGFVAAANTLLDCVISDGGISLMVDTLVYPICFTMRHAIELFLKKNIEDLNSISIIRRSPLPNFNQAASHDLGLIWNYLKTHATKTDERLIQHIEILDEYISDFAKIDATGQVFRYPYDLDNGKHLISTGGINLYILKEKFKAIQELLKRLNETLLNILEEYEWKTFTNNLSRNQLRKIAKLLPNKTKWKRPFFEKVKIHLRKKYKLGSREFSKALNLIQQRHEMAECIGVQTPIPNLSIDALINFFDKWVIVNDINLVVNPPESRIIPSSEMRGQMKAYILNLEIAKKLAITLANEISPDEYAPIDALFKFKAQTPFSEAFERIIEIDKAQAEIHKSSPEIFQQSLMETMKSKFAIHNIVSSLDFLGQTEAVETIIKRYNLENARERILKQSTFLKNLPT